MKFTIEQFIEYLHKEAKARKKIEPEFAGNLDFAADLIETFRDMSVISYKGLTKESDPKSF